MLIILIYQALKEAQKGFGENELKFFYEPKPTVDNEQLPMKTDFTLITKRGIWYWEHLGRLGNKKYEWTWHNVKKKTYDDYGLMDRLLTTDEGNGIKPDKIKEIIEIVVNDLVESEDPTNSYSLHNFSLRRKHKAVTAGVF